MYSPKRFGVIQNMVRASALRKNSITFFICTNHHIDEYESIVSRSFSLARLFRTCGKRLLLRSLRAKQISSMSNMEGVVAKVQSLSDLELATLLCLVAKQHCLIETEEDVIDDLSQEVALVRSRQSWYERALG